MMCLSWKQILSFKSCHRTEQDGSTVLQGGEWDINVSFPLFWCRLCMDSWSVLLSHVATCSWTAWINTRIICHFQSVLIYIASFSTCCKKVLRNLVQTVRWLHAAFVRICLDQSLNNSHDYRIQCKHIRCSPQPPTMPEQSYRKSQTKLSHGARCKCKPGIGDKCVHLWRYMYIQFVIGLAAAVIANIISIL